MVRLRVRGSARPRRQREQLLVEGLLHVAAGMERLQAGQVGDGAQRAGAVGGMMERLPKRRLVMPQDLGLGLGLG